MFGYKLVRKRNQYKPVLKKGPDGFMTYTDQLGRIVKLKETWTDIYGNKYYTFEDVKEMAANRHIAGKTAVIEAEFGCSKEQAIEAMDGVVKALNTQDYSTAAYKALLLKTKFQKADAEKAYLSLATVYVLMEGERPDSYEPEFAKKKLDLWERDIDTRLFFLNTAYTTTESLIGTLNLDMATYLMTKILTDIKPQENLPLVSK